MQANNEWRNRIYAEIEKLKVYASIIYKYLEK